MSGSQSSNWRSGNWRDASSGSPSPGPGAGPAAPGDTASPRNAGPSKWRSNEGGTKPSPWTSGNSRSSDASAAAAKATEEGRRIYMGNLQYSARAADVEELLARHGLAAAVAQPGGVHISVDPFSARNPGYCFVEFARREDAEAALEALGKDGGAELLERPVKVGPCVPKGERRERDGGGGEAGGERPRREGGGRGWGSDRDGDRERYSGGDKGRRGWGESRGDSPREKDGQYEGRRQWEVPEDNKRLYVGGLPRMDNQEDNERFVRALFQGFTVETVSKQPPPPADASSRPQNYGYCFVDLTTPEEAVAAIQALNGKQIEGGELRVSPAKSNTSRQREKGGYSSTGYRARPEGYRREPGVGPPKP